MAVDITASNPSTPSETQQYQVDDPIQATTGNTSIVSGDPTQQPPAAPLGQAQAPVDPQSPAVNTQVQPSQQNPGQAPMNQQAPPPSRTQRFISKAREIGDALAGGDPYTTKIDPKTGETTRTRQPLSGRAMSLAILLEAIGGGIAGAGEHGPDAVGKAAQAGLQKGEQIAQQQNERQADLDQQAQTDLRNKQQVMINNLQTRQLAMSLGRQSLEQAQKSVDADSANWQSHQDDPTSILAQNLSHDDVYAMLNKIGLGNAQVLVTGTRPRTDPKTGKPVYQLPNGQIVDEDTPGAYQAPDFTYALIKPDAKVTITDSDGNLNPSYQKAIQRGYYAANLGSNGKLPANYQITGLASQAALRGSQIADAVQDDVNQSRAASGLQPISIDADLKQDSNVRQGLLAYNAVLNGGGTHQQALDAVLKSKWASAAGTIQNWYGGRQATQHLDAQRANQAFDSGVLNGDIKLDSPQNIASARLSSNPKVKAAGEAQYQQNQNDALEADRRKQQQDENIRVGGVIREAEAKQRLASEDPATLQSNAKMLVDGNLDPTQLSKRSKTYDAQLAAANQYSMSTYGVPFDVEKAQRDYRYASQTSTINTLNFLNSVTSSGQAVLNTQSKIGSTQFPALNDKKQWAQLAVGNANVAAYHATLTEYADQVAKILQGGGSGSGTSDAKLKQAQELFEKGFNKYQMGATIGAVTTLLNNRKDSMVGTNRYLLKDTMPKPPQMGAKLGADQWKQYLKAYGTPQAASQAAAQQGWN